MLLEIFREISYSLLQSKQEAAKESKKEVETSNTPIQDPKADELKQELARY